LECTPYADSSYTIHDAATQQDLFHDNGAETSPFSTTPTTAGSGSSSSIGERNNIHSYTLSDFIATANIGAKTITFSTHASTARSGIVGNINFRPMPSLGAAPAPARSTPSR
jgi:hypothetical protein